MRNNLTKYLKFSFSFMDLSLVSVEFLFIFNLFSEDMGHNLNDGVEKIDKALIGEHPHLSHLCDHFIK
jgi:hypothetical protein